MPVSPIVFGLLAVTAVVLAFAFWKGRAAERLTAGAVAINMAMGVARMTLAPDADSILRFANDGLTALFLLAVAVRYASPWMVGVMFFYAAQFAMHAYYMMTGRNDRDYLHALINNINNMGIIACLAVGAAVAWRQRVRSRAASGASSSPARRR